MSQKLIWKTEQRRIKDLIPLDINPRKINTEKLKKLAENLEKYNVVEIPVIDTDNKLLTFHQRLKALLICGRGEEIIDVRVPNRKLTEKEIKEYNLIANTHAGDFDIELIEEHFGDIVLEDIGIEMSDIDINIAFQEIKNDLKQKNSLEQLEALDDDYNIPESVKTDIVLGDIFQIGPHKLICGDSTQTDTFSRLFGQELADLVVTDPPYNVALGYETPEQAKARNRRTDGKVIKNDKMSNEDFYQFLYDFFTALSSYTKSGGGWYVWHADSQGGSFRKAMQDAGLLLKQCLVWVKDTLVMGRQDYHWKHEPCLYGWKEGAAHKWYGDRKQTTVLQFKRPQRNAEHPTMKPVELIAYQIRNSSKKGDIVCDAFGGSGTTMVACHQMGRIARVVEFDPNYCQVIIDRMKNLDPEIVVKKLN